MKSELDKLKRRLERIEQGALTSYADHDKEEPKPGKRDKDGEFWTNEQWLKWDGLYGYSDMRIIVNSLHKIAVEAITITKGKREELYTALSDILNALGYGEGTSQLEVLDGLAVKARIVLAKAKGDL